MRRSCDSLLMEDLQKDLKDKNLVVSTLPEKGRCLFTTRDFNPGEVILSEDPYVSVPNKNKESPNSKCEWCFSSSNLKKCSACHAVWYCGSTCQKLDWKLHSVECKALAKVDKERLKSLTPSICLMVKLYLRRKLQQQKMANLVNLILQWPEPEINIKEITENFSKLACNAHSICDNELRPLGTGLYPVISVINHSCLPNSVLVFEGRLAVVRAVQHIPKGTEVSISYVETAGSTITRQKALKEQYFFSCTCSRCIKMGQCDDVEESAVLEGYRCKDSRCNGFLLHDSDNKGFICQHCGLLRNKEEIENAASEVSSMSEKASMVLSSGYHTQASHAYKMIEKLQMELCHPLSINLMRTRETLLKVFMELQDWKEALSYCRLTIPIYQRAYPPFHPLLGLQYYTCGKLEWLLEETAEAVKSLTEAFDVLRITHGTRSPFVMELLSKLDEARAEASYKRSSQNED